jgi:GNAT superfamily N-acetyltransferase
MTSDSELFRRVWQLLRTEAELFGSSSEQARLLRLPGVLASVNAAAPDRSIFNWVVSETPAAMLSVYDELARAYDAAGVRAWTVWVDDGDAATEQALLARGHLLDAKPRAMAAEVSALQLPESGDLEWRETHDFKAIAAINDAAYSFPPPAFSAAIQRCELPGARAYLALLDGREVAAVMSHESSAGDCGITCVATLPEARGRGLASRLLAVAVRAAAARGAITTTLQATSKGAPVYTRLGYRDLGSINMWEHRVAKPA